MTIVGNNAAVMKNWKAQGNGMDANETTRSPTYRPREQVVYRPTKPDGTILVKGSSTEHAILSLDTWLDVHQGKCPRVARLEKIIHLVTVESNSVLCESRCDSLV